MPSEVCFTNFQEILNHHICAYKSCMKWSSHGDRASGDFYFLFQFVTCVTPEGLLDGERKAVLGLSSASSLVVLCRCWQFASLVPPNPPHRCMYTHGYEPPGIWRSEDNNSLWPHLWSRLQTPVTRLGSEPLRQLSHLVPTVSISDVMFTQLVLQPYFEPWCLNVT